MKKCILMMAVFCFAFTATQAQIADGSTAPDFTATDINGEEHNLYELLDAGKTVILDVSATWCGPCWSYHNSGALDELYECYGEEGTDNVVVFMVEGDAGTTLGDLNGTGSSTLGDWVTGTPYPIIDDATIAQAYEITYFPTVYRICPGDKTVYELGQAGAQAAKNAVLNEDCTPAVRTNDAALSCSKSSGVVCSAFETELTATLFNSGSANLTAATIIAKVNGEEVGSIDWTGNLGLYEEIDVPVSSISGVVEDTDVTFEVIITDDEHMENNDAHATLAKAPDLATAEDTEVLTLELLTDNYGNETYWVMFDGSGNMLAEGGNAGVGLTNTGVGAGSPPADPGAYGNNETIIEEITVPANDCYNLVLTDFWGDGICCSYGNGYYSLKNSAGEVLLEGAGFGARVDNPFEKSTIVSNEEVVVANSFAVFPNPVRGEAVVEFGLIESTRVTLEVVNAVGQVIYTSDAARLTDGLHTRTINMSDFQAGVYFVNIRTEQGVSTTRLIKQ